MIVGGQRLVSLKLVSLKIESPETPVLDPRKAQSSASGFRPDDPLRALGLRPHQLPGSAGRVASALAPPAAAAAARLDDPTRTELALALIAGAAPAAVVADLIRRGVDPVLARAEVDQAAPYVAAAARMAGRLAKREWLFAILARLEDQREPGIARLHAPDPQTFFRDHWLTLRPAVLTGLVDHWPALRLWSLDHMARVVSPDTEVEVQTGRTADPDFEINSPAHKTRMRWGEVLDRLRADPETNDFYITANNGTVNRRALAPLWAEIGPIPGFLAKNRMGDGFFWMGPRGSITPWHHDLTQNFLMNVVGTKRVRLVSPSRTPAMQNHIHCFSRFATRTDLPAACAMETVDIGPGEILFIPVGWWHHVEGRTLTMGMSFTNFVWDNSGFEADYRAHGEL